LQVYEFAQKDSIDIELVESMHLQRKRRRKKKPVSMVKSLPKNPTKRLFRSWFK
jgi:hypothetical protein